MKPKVNFSKLKIISFSKYNFFKFRNYKIYFENKTCVLNVKVKHVIES